MSDTLAPLVKAANNLLVVRYIFISVRANIAYDYFLTIGDEISYVWRREKSWISCLFLVSRYLLLVYAIVSGPGDRRPPEYDYCRFNQLTGASIGLFLLVVSDIFVLLRIYAVTNRNKLVALYLSSLVCAKAIVSAAFISGVRIISLPDIPIEAFETCILVGSFPLEITPQVISLVFDVSAFGTLVFFAYSSAGILRFSSLFRTILADATVYFLMVMALQTLMLFFLSLADDTISQFPLILNTILVPTLINRAVLSLKKAADISGEYSGGWSMGHFSAVKFPPASAPVSSTTFSTQPPDDPLETRFDSHNDIQLDEFDQHARP